MQVGHFLTSTVLIHTEMDRGGKAFSEKLVVGIPFIQTLTTERFDPQLFSIMERRYISRLRKAHDFRFCFRGGFIGRVLFQQECSYLG